jgi:hypothetical protein
MHLLIPFAHCSSVGCQAALPALQLPNLTRLLSRLTPEPLDQGDELSLSPPHERALARALGWPLRDGLLPWAAQQARQNGAWAFITPCYWQVHGQRIAMSAQALQEFSEDDSRSLLAAMQPYFEEDGIRLIYDQPTRWLACADVFRELPSASLDRVLGRLIQPWMPQGRVAAKLLRLQNEMQMLLYQHPVNDARTLADLAPVNSFWLSGTGALPDLLPGAAKPAPAVVIDSLRQPALSEDWTAWTQHWQQIDANQCSALLSALNTGDSVRLTLCGERHAQTWQALPQSLITRLKQRLANRPASSILETL